MMLLHGIEGEEEVVVAGLGTNPGHGDLFFLEDLLSKRDSTREGWVVVRFV